MLFSLFEISVNIFEFHTLKMHIFKYLLCGLPKLHNLILPLVTMGFARILCQDH